MCTNQEHKPELGENNIKRHNRDQQGGREGQEEQELTRHRWKQLRRDQRSKAEQTQTVKQAVTMKQEVQLTKGKGQNKKTGT